MSSLRSELAPMLRLALPVVLAELGWMSMGIVDTLMVAPLGPAAIGAAGIGTSVHMAFAVFGMGLLLGLDTLVSQAHGAGDHRDCHRWLVHGVVMGAALTVPIIAVCLAVLAFFPHAGFHPDVAPLLQSYFGIVIWSTVPLLLYAAVRRYLQGMHVVAPIAFALVTANLLNAAANWTLIHGRFGLPALGVSGAAWATVISRVYMLGVLVVAAWWIDRAGNTGLTTVSRTLSRERFARLWRLGFPAASQVTLEVGVFGLATALAGRLDPVSSAAHQIALNIAGASFMVPLGVASAGAVRVGNRVGAHDPQGAARAGWMAILLGSGFMGAAAVLFFLAPRALIGAFSPGPAVVDLGASLLFVAAIFQLFDGLQAVATGALRGLGSTRMAMMVNLAGHWFVGLPIAYVLCFPLGLGVRGLWMGLSTGLIVCGVVLTWYWHRRISHYTSTGRLR
jgi:MATE family multidrug resistance protein